jgi:hypothetical protein
MDKDEMKYGFDVELSERELLSIGKITALWGSLEYEIFFQTLMTFSDSKDSKLPKGSEGFSQVLEIWETRVVNKAEGRRKEALQEQCRRIRHYQDFRNALAHGMWDWSTGAPEKITATRVRKKEVLSTTFTADDLASFALVLSEINFAVRYPGGFEDYAISMAEQGSGISRRGFSLMTSNPLASDFFPPPPSEARQKTEE